MAFQDLEGRSVVADVEPIDPYRYLPATDRALMSLVDRLGYTMTQAAGLLGLAIGAAHKRYWRSRAKLRPPKLLREELLERSPDLLPRDLCALELVEVLEYSIGRAAKVLNINKGHLCRRLALARDLIQTGGDPRNTPSVDDQRQRS